MLSHAAVCRHLKQGKRDQIRTAKSLQQCIDGSYTCDRAMLHGSYISTTT